MCITCCCCCCLCITYDDVLLYYNCITDYFCTEPLKPLVLHTPLSICHYYITLHYITLSTAFWFFMTPPIYARLRLYVPMSVPMFRANIDISFDSHDYTERISMKFGEVITTTYRWTAKLYLVRGNRQFESTSNRCCHVANDFINFIVYMTRCGRSVGESITHMQRRRHHMTAFAPFIFMLIMRASTKSSHNGNFWHCVCSFRYFMITRAGLSAFFFSLIKLSVLTARACAK